MNTLAQIITFVLGLLEKQSEASRVKIIDAITGTYCTGCGRKHADRPSGHCQCERDE